MRIDLYSISGCPWCDKAREHLKLKGLPFNEIKISNDAESKMSFYVGFRIPEEQRTFPQIFIDTVRVEGGYQGLRRNPQMRLTIEDLKGHLGLLSTRVGYKPFAYPWAFDMWKIQQQVHWMPEEVPLGEDVKDWATKLDDNERNLLTQIFRFFTQADIEVQDNYMERYATVFKPTEVKMMLSAFANMETIHIAAYALLLETIGMPESEFGAFMEYEELKDKHDYMQEFGMETAEDVLRTLAMFGGFSEGLQLFASFAMLMNFPRFNKMKGMGQIVSWSVRDESLHCDGIIKLFHAFAQESGALTQEVKDDIVENCRVVVSMEDRFIDLAFALGPVEGMEADDIKKYIRFIADWRLQQLGLDPIYGITENPLPWLQALLSGVEHANFFEARATEYSKAATQGDWEKDVFAPMDEQNGINISTPCSPVCDALPQEPST